MSNDGGVETQLNQDIGIVGAIALGVGTMIAAGIFVLSGLAVANVGAVSIFSFLLAAVVASFTAFAYAEFASIYPESGGGYAYVANTFEKDWTYFVGWAMILGYPASAAFYLASFSDWFFRFMYPALSIPKAIPYWIPGLIILALLTAVNLKGTEESGQFQIIVTAAKVALIILFLYGGLQAFDASAIQASFAENITKFREIGVTTALVFITFFGFEAIATNAEEIENPGRNVPRAIFISMGFVTVVYALVVLVIVLAVNNPDFLTFLANEAGLAGSEAAQEFVGENGEVAMGRAAQFYLGNAGFYIVIVGALFSMLSAANATILAGSRVKLAMARRDHLPSRFENLHSRFETPSNSVYLTSFLIVGFILLFSVIFGSPPGEGGHSSLLGVEAIAHFADFMLLTGLVAVNFAVIGSRRNKDHLEREFKVPLVPYIPYIAIVANLILLINVEPVSFVIGIIAQLIGALIWYFVIGRTDPAELEEETPTVVAERTPENTDYSILVPIANPEHTEQLMRTATDIASDKNGEIVALSVVQIPEQTPLSEGEKYIDEEREVVDSAMEFAQDRDVPVNGVVRIAHEIDDAVLNTIEQYDCDSTIMGWSGRSSYRRDVVLGSVVDTVTAEAEGDILVERVGNASNSADDILVPVVAGENVQLAAETARAIARQNNANITLLSVLTDDISDEDRNAPDEIEAMLDDVPVDIERVESNNIKQTILSKSDDFDLTIVGAAREGWLRQLVVGNTAAEIGQEADGTVIMAKRNEDVSSRIQRLLDRD